MNEAKKDGKPFDFTHVVLIMKLHEPIRKSGEASTRKKLKGSEILFVNAEEEPIAEVKHLKCLHYTYLNYLLCLLTISRWQKLLLNFL